MVEERLAFLRRFPLWAGLSDEFLQAVAAAMAPIKHQAGELIIRQGEPGSRLSVLAAGQAEARVHTESGTVVTVATFREGDCFGEMSLLSGEATSADVVALEESETLALEREAFNALVAANPNLLREFVRTVSRRLSEADLAVGAAREKEQDLTRFLQEEKSEQYSVLAGKDRAIKELQQQVDRQAQLAGPLLIQGERGTGKELLARLIHFRSPRKDAPLLSTDCAQVAENQWGDQLFGDYHRREPGRPRGLCYMDLAEGGALLLKNIEALPPAIQERLVRFLKSQSEPSANRRNVRVIITSRGNLRDETMAGLMSPDLVAVLLENVITVPSLREHKRDIPELANHFVRKHAQRLNKRVDSLDDQAIIKLVSYDYQFANVQELEESLERAVILTDDATINAEEIFLGPPPSVRPRGFNLLSLPKPLVRFGLRVFPTVIRGFTLALFVFILLVCFLGAAEKSGNLGTLLVWSMWWPALALSFFFAGRAWCAICPMASVGAAAQRLSHLERRIPAWLKDYDVYIAMAGFFAIVWVEEVTGMRHAPLATGLLLLSILAGAVITSFLFPRRTWCRHLCPLGGFAGLCSTSAMLELRPTLDVCTAKCKGHSCYKGEEGITGCPMFQHVMFVDSNQYCVLCMNCVRSCPNSSPQLNVRVPGRELWTSLIARPEVGRFVALLLGLLVALTFIQRWEQQTHGLLSRLMKENHFLFVTGVLVISAALPLLTLQLAARRLGKSPNAAVVAQFWQKVIAWTPLVTAGYAGYQLANVAGFGNLQIALGYHAPADSGGAHTLIFSLLSTAQVGILSLGLVVTVAALWKLWQANGRGERRSWLRGQAVSLAGAVTYWGVLLTLMLKPEWLSV